LDRVIDVKGDKAERFGVFIEAFAGVGCEGCWGDVGDTLGVGFTLFVEVVELITC